MKVLQMSAILPYQYVNTCLFIQVIYTKYDYSYSWIEGDSSINASKHKFTLRGILFCLLGKMSYIKMKQ